MSRLEKAIEWFAAAVDDAREVDVPPADLVPRIRALLGECAQRFAAALQPKVASHERNARMAWSWLLGAWDERPAPPTFMGWRFDADCATLRHRWRRVDVV